MAESARPPKTTPAPAVRPRLRTVEENTDIIIRGIEDLKARCAARIAELELEVLALKAERMPGYREPCGCWTGAWHSILPPPMCPLHAPRIAPALNPAYPGTVWNDHRITVGTGTG